MPEKKRKLFIIDVGSVEKKVKPAVKVELEHLSHMKKGDYSWNEYGRNLDTVVRARAWLTDKRNWFSGQSRIIKWDGIIPAICESHGQQLVDNPDDDGLPEVVVVAQRSYRAGKKEEPELVDVVE